ncbi:hypothetical protein QR685DRAFT_513077 [Neurospora intermedia]|uniref:Uncharacterized protein n=1 Tax=Neurospora intermedia TaxID=5142 RepID=A0ABR3DSA4_NEUIN
MRGEERREICWPDRRIVGMSGCMRRYINYANGDEPLQALFGYEEWRWERLTALKREEYDPEGV